MNARLGISQAQTAQLVLLALLTHTNLSMALLPHALPVLAYLFRLLEVPPCWRVFALSALAEQTAQLARVRQFFANSRVPRRLSCLQRAAAVRTKTSSAAHRVCPVLKTRLLRLPVSLFCNASACLRTRASTAPHALFASLRPSSHRSAHLPARSARSTAGRLLVLYQSLNASAYLEQPRQRMESIAHSAEQTHTKAALVLARVCRARILGSLILAAPQYSSVGVQRATVETAVVQRVTLANTNQHLALASAHPADLTRTTVQLLLFQRRVAGACPVLQARLVSVLVVRLPRFLWVTRRVPSVQPALPTPTRRQLVQRRARRACVYPASRGLLLPALVYARMRFCVFSCTFAGCMPNVNIQIHTLELCVLFLSSKLVNTHHSQHFAQSMPLQPFV